MEWQPLNLTTTCPANAQFTACSSFGFVYLNLLVRLYGEAICEPHCVEYKKKCKKFDFIVVGAGAAGCVVANRLSKNPNWTVLLLEAGPEQPEITLPPALSITLIGSSIDWQFKTEPDGKSCLAYTDGRCDWPRGKTMGGSSSINSMSYIRGNKVDFDIWASLGNPGWSYNEVLPFFKKSERNLNIEGLDRRYHGDRGEQSIERYPYIDFPAVSLIESFSEAGIPLTEFNGFQQLGTNQAQAFVNGGKRASTYSSFIQPIRQNRKNLSIRPNSEVIKILINDNNIAYGVRYRQNNEVYTVYAKKEVIVSAGAINSPQILMLSGIGPKNHLESLGIPVIKDLAVGRNLQDHITFNGILIGLTNVSATTVDKQELLKQVIKYGQKEVKTGPLSGNGPGNSLAFIRTTLGLSSPDIEFQLNEVMNWREYVKDPVSYLKNSIFPTAFYDGMIPRPSNLVTLSRGYILLNASNIYGKPLIYPNYFGDERDLLPLVRGTKILLSLENTEKFKSVGFFFVKQRLPACKDYEWGSDEYIICLARSYTSSPYHPTGSCRMGPRTDKTAVVDNELRVYGIKGLRVIDASIMPNITSGNTCAPSIMIGERGVDFVIKRWSQ